MTEQHDFIQSTNVDRATYDITRRQLIVRFLSGRRYMYSEVPIDVWKKFCMSASPGKYVQETLVKYGPREIDT